MLNNLFISGEDSYAAGNNSICFTMKIILELRQEVNIVNVFLTFIKGCLNITD